MTYPCRALTWSWLRQIRAQVISALVSSRPCNKHSYTNTNTDQWITKAMHNSLELEWVCQNSNSRYISLAADTRDRAWPSADKLNVLNEDLGFPTIKFRFMIYREDLQDPHEGCWGCSWQMQAYYALPPAASTTSTQKSHTHQVR
jgi:hypothetical protein